MDEVFSNERRRSATIEMRERARYLRQQAAQWESLANRLDELEAYAKSQSKDGEEGPVPYIGVGSQDEAFLWEIATFYFKK